MMDLEKPYKLANPNGKKVTFNDVMTDRRERRIRRSREFLKNPDDL